LDSALINEGSGLMPRKKEDERLPLDASRAPERTPALPPPDNPQLRQDAEDAGHGQSGLTEAEMARRRAQALEQSRKLPPDPATESKKRQGPADER
jgi:hypothetical protein